MGVITLLERERSVSRRRRFTLVKRAHASRMLRACFEELRREADRTTARVPARAHDDDSNDPPDAA